MSQEACAGPALMRIFIGMLVAEVIGGHHATPTRAATERCPRSSSTCSTAPRGFRARQERFGLPARFDWKEELFWPVFRKPTAKPR